MTSALCYLCGYMTGMIAFMQMARRRHLDTPGVLSVMGAGLVGGLAGANLAEWIVTGSGGKTILGGLVGGYLAVVLYKRHIGLRRPLGDLFAVAISAGEAVGRWGCFFGGCCYGKATDVPWAVWQHGAFRHPTQIYLSLASLTILILLLRYDRTAPPENALFYLQGLLYCAARFTIEFYRESEVLFCGLTAAQWACCVGILFFAIRLHGLLRRKGVAFETVS